MEQLQKYLVKKELNLQVKKVYDSEEKCLQAILAGKINKGTAIVIKNEGPVGGPGMREMCPQRLQSWVKDWQ